MDRQIKKSISYKFYNIIYVIPIYLHYKTLFFFVKVEHKKKKQLAADINDTPIMGIMHT